MTNFKYLEKACGGAITIESLKEFKRAVDEYERFMEMGRAMFAPVEPGPDIPYGAVIADEFGGDEG